MESEQIEEACQTAGRVYSVYIYIIYTRFFGIEIVFVSYLQTHAPAPINPATACIMYAML